MHNVVSNQTSPELAINANFDALRHMELHAQNPATTTGLTWGSWGGFWDGAVIANATTSLTDNATNYVVMNWATGAVSASTSTTDWNDSTGYTRLYEVTTLSGGISAVVDYRSGPSGLHGKWAGGKLASAIDEATPVSVASASSITLNSVAANTVNITGTTTINTLGVVSTGGKRTLIFAAALTLVNSASLILPQATDIKTSPDDVAEFVSTGSNVWTLLSYRPATRPTPSVPSVLTSSSTITPDASLSSKFTLVLGTNATLANPTGMVDGQEFMIRVTQDATGSRTLAYGSKFLWAAADTHTLSTAANAVDMIYCSYFATADKIYARMVKAFA